MTSTNGVSGSGVRGKGTKSLFLLERRNAFPDIGHVGDGRMPRAVPIVHWKLFRHGHRSRHRLVIDLKEEDNDH